MAVTRKGNRGNANLKAGPGRPKGKKSQKTILWEEFGKLMIDNNIPRAQEFMEELWESGDFDMRLKAMYIFMDMLEFFKPKLARITHEGDTDILKPVILIPPTIPVNKNDRNSKQ